MLHIVQVTPREYHPVAGKTRRARYLERAAELRAIADQMEGGDARATLRKAAADYERMAKREPPDRDAPTQPEK